MASAAAPDRDDGPQPTAHGLSRRRFLERVGVGAGTVVTVAAGGARVAPRYSPIGRAAALPPAVVVAAASAPAAAYLTKKAVDYFTGDDVDGLDDYTGKTALQDENYLRHVSMDGSNDSMYTVIENRIEDSKNVAWSRGKIEAIEVINAGGTEQEAIDAALAANDDYYSTIEENLLNHHHEQVNKIDHAMSLFEQHSDWTQSGYNENAIRLAHDGSGYFYHDSSSTFVPTSYTLKNGESIDVKVMQTDYISPFKDNSHSYNCYMEAQHSDGSVVRLYEAPSGGQLRVRQLLQQINTHHSDMESNLQTWVQEAYTEFQQGDIEIQDMMDPMTFASELSASEDSNVAYAAADLVAMGVETDLQTTYELHLLEDDVKVKGILAGNDLGTISTGETIDPAELTDDVYLAYDRSTGSGTVDPADYDGLDGGELTFYSEPFAETIYTIETGHGETATATRSDFTEDTDADGNDVWITDLSDQLDEPVTTVETITMEADGDGRELIVIEQQFEVLSIVDHDGNEREESTFESYNHQTSDVSLTQEQLEKLLEAREGMDQYEKSDDSDGDDGLGLFGGWGFESGDVVGLAIVGGVVAVMVGVATDMIPILGD